jgi:DNA-binding NarL/FixJ family response regulator
MPDAPPQPDLSVLSEREREVLRLRGMGLNRREIAKQICKDEETVKKELGRIGDKVGVRGLKLAVLSARLQAIGIL